MTSLHMLDTNMVSYIVKGRSPAARARLLALKEDEVAAVSAITEAEIRYGLAKRPEATAPCEGYKRTVDKRQVADFFRAEPTDDSARRLRFNIAPTIPCTACRSRARRSD